MKLVTKEVEKKLEKFPFYSQEGKGMDAEVVVKFFNPFGSGTWLVTEAQKQENGDWLFFGYFYISGWEWGYVLLSDLENVFGNTFYKIERDLYSSGTVKEMM